MTPDASAAPLEKREPDEEQHSKDRQDGEHRASHGLRFPAFLQLVADVRENLTLLLGDRTKSDDAAGR